MPNQRTEPDSRDDGKPSAREEVRADRRRRAQQKRAMSKTQSQTGRPAERRSGILQFSKESWAELKRVQWPTSSQMWQATAVVLIACLIVGLYLWGLDAIFKPMAKWLVDQQSASH